MRIDLNCDVGEGIGNDAALMPFITSANIACGYHAGNKHSVRQTILLAKAHGVRVGAHPSLPDKENFGRTEMRCTVEEVYDWVTKQLRLVKTIADECDLAMHHVKPHGALYNMAAKDYELAMAIAKAVRDFDAGAVLFGLSGSQSIKAAEAIGLVAWSEAFADRSYQDNGSLTPRSQPGALITDEAKAVEQVMRMLNGGTVLSVSGKEVLITAQTVCLHGDGPNAVRLAERLYRVLKASQL